MKIPKPGNLHFKHALLVTNVDSPRASKREKYTNKNTGFFLALKLCNLLMGKLKSRAYYTYCIQ